MIKLFAKKQIILTFITIIISTMLSGQATFSGGGSGTQNDPWTIITVDDWDAFAASVNNDGYTYDGKYIQLRNDLSGITNMVGWFSGGAWATGKAFNGTFDGNGHTKTVAIDGNSDYAGPFAWVDGATICNLIVDGTINTDRGGQHAGGIVSCVEDKDANDRTTYIKNCTSKVTIVCTNNHNDGHHGGLVGWLYNGALTFENCSFEGTMQNYKAKDQIFTPNNCAGFVGEIEESFAPEVLYTNCSQVHVKIDNATDITFGTFHLPSDYKPANYIPHGTTGWETAYVIHRITNDLQGTIAPTSVPDNAISKKYVREVGGVNRTYYVPQAIMDMPTGVKFYGDVYYPKLTYCGNVLRVKEDYSVITSPDKTSIVINGIEEAGYYGVIKQAITLNQIGSWSNLKTKIAASSEGTRIFTLDKDYTCGSSETYLEVKGTVILDLNGHTLNRGLYDQDGSETNEAVSNGFVIKVTKKGSGNGELTIKDSENGAGIIRGGNNSGNGGGIVNEGTLIVEGGTITRNYCVKSTNVYGLGGGICSTGVLKMYGGNVTHNESDGGGGGIYVSGSAYIQDVVITNNKAQSKGGGIRVISNNVKVIGCEIKDNLVKPTTADASDGGALYFNSQNNLVSGCTISGNNASYRGGAIYTLNNGGNVTSVTLENCLIENNTALGMKEDETGGGALFLYQGEVKLKNCTIRGNVSHTVGGIYLRSGAKLEILGGKIIIDQNIGDATKANVYMAKNSDKIKFSGAIDRESLIGVSRSGAGVITDGLAGNNRAIKRNFRSDNYILYWLMKTDDAGHQTEVSLSQSDKWSEGTYNASDKTITFASTADYNKYELKDDGDVFTIKAPIIIDKRTKTGSQLGREFPNVKSIVLVGDGAIFIEEKVANNVLSYGQFYYNGSTIIPASVIKVVKGPSNPTAADATGWYTISAPLEIDRISENTNLITSKSEPYNFDLLGYDEPWRYWRSYTYHEPNAFNPYFENDKFVYGRGYLYRNAKDINIEYTGTIITKDVICPVTYTPKINGVENPSRGFNLIGNPYTHNITLKNTTLVDANGDQVYEGSVPINLDAAYVLSRSGSWESCVIGDGDDITMAQGMLVQIPKNADIQGVKFSQKEREEGKYNNEFIRFTVANSEYEDKAYALFENGCGLTKIDHRNTDVPMIYINQEGGNYAVATMGDETKAFNLNFKATKMGRYTLTCKTEGEFSYLHIIDRLAGQDIDMLSDGEYSFIGSPKDKEARFIVRLQYKPDYSDNNDIFAYQNGDDVLVSGEGELQVFDVTGRFVTSRRVNGVEALKLNATGVYILKLIGEEIHTQKIVVR